MIASYLADDPDFAKDLVERALNAVLEGEMTELLGCEKGERSTSRRGYRSGHDTQQQTMKVGTLELRLPQDRDGHFSTRVFERYRRTEKALVSILAEMYVNGTSTRKVGKLAEDLCGHAYSHTSISNMVAELDEALLAFASRRLDDTSNPYALLDARYEKVREAGAVRTRAVQIAVGIDEVGRRHLLAVELADRESENTWTTFLSGLKARGLKGVEYVASDSHEGLKHAIAKVLPMALWQRCAVHFLRNAYDHASHQTDPACLADLKRMWNCTDMAHAPHELDIWIRRWGEEPGCEKLVTWVEDNIEETFSVYRLPRAHRVRMKSTNMLERYNEEIRRRTRVMRIFPNEASCLRLIRALAVETHDQWVSGKRYLTGSIGLEKETMKLKQVA